MKKHIRFDRAIKRLLLYTILATGFFLFGCTTAPRRNTVYQESTIDALLSGGYDGKLSLDQLRRHGRFGIGTFDKGGRKK